MSKFARYFIKALILLGFSSAFADAKAFERIKTSTLLSKEGSLFLTFKTQRAFRNGNAQKGEENTLLKIANMGELRFGLCEDLVSAIVQWRWDRKAKAATPGTRNLTVVCPEIPGPDTYHLSMTWDKEARLFSMYLNGIPFVIPDRARYKFKTPQVGEILFNRERFSFVDIKTQDKYLRVDEMVKAIPTDFYRRNARNLFGTLKKVTSVDVEKRRGKLLYENSLSSREAISKWVIDAGKYTFVDGWMQVQTDGGGKGKGSHHMVIWCPQTFPDKFVAEWEVRVIKDHFCMVIFAAKGKDGEDIFDPSLPKRTGSFMDYIKGAIKNYYIAYSAQQRGRCGLRKNNKFYLLTTGTEGILENCPPEEVNRIRLIKDSEHIQCLVNGKVVIDHMDQDADRYDEAYRDGKIGFRQMHRMVGQYRNFKVWALKEETAAAQVATNK